MFSFLLLLWIIIQGYAIWWLWFFEQELIISFLPYIVGCNIVIIALLIIVRIYYTKRRFVIMGVLYILFTLFGIHTIQQTFFHHTQTITESETSLSFFYSNIYYQNIHTENILHTITERNPDIIMLVEYAKYHDEILTPQLKELYPYVSRYIGSKWYDGDIIFSKYPLKKITHPTIPGAFSHISILYKNKQLDIALLHTSAPISRHFFDMRTKQLDELKEILVEYYTTYSSDNIILAGDFNITPWSPYYTTQLMKPLQSIGLSNITNNTSLTQYKRYLPYTRCLRQFPLACAQIDHIWGNHWNIKLEQIIVPGSDHTGFYGTIYLQ